MPWTCAPPSVLRAWTLCTLCDPHLVVLVSLIFSLIVPVSLPASRRKLRRGRWGFLSPHFLQDVCILYLQKSIFSLIIFAAVYTDYLLSLWNFSMTECGLVCHVKCAPNLPRTCGLPSQFVEHFSETLQEQKTDENDKTNIQSSTRLSGKREGWLRVPRYDIPIQFSWSPRSYMYVFLFG